MVTAEQIAAAELRQALTNTSFDPSHKLSQALGLYGMPAHLDNGTKAMLMLAAFIEKYGGVLELVRNAHAELNK